MVGILQDLNLCVQLRIGFIYAASLGGKFIKLLDIDVGTLIE